MVPAVGSSKPAIIRSTVVLPDPDGPSMEKNSPSPISRSAPATATTGGVPEKTLRSPLNRTARSAEPLAMSHANPATLDQRGTRPCWLRWLRWLRWLLLAVAGCRWSLLSRSGTRRGRGQCVQGPAVQPVGEPVIHRLPADRVVEADRGGVPSQHPPLEAAVAALGAHRCQRGQELLTQ